MGNDQPENLAAEASVERIFFLSGIAVIALGAVVGHLIPDSNSSAAESFAVKLFNVTGISLGVLFAALNLRGWKLITGTILKAASRSPGKASNASTRLNFLIIAKLGLMFTALLLLMRFGKPLVLSFLTGMAGYFMFGSLAVYFLSLGSRRT